MSTKGEKNTRKVGLNHVAFFDWLNLLIV